MLDAPGAGLAAPQIGVPLRVFVWDVDEALGHLINPTLDLSEEMQDGEEGLPLFPRNSLRHSSGNACCSEGFQYARGPSNN
jgi:peptide deformylase